MMYSSSFVDIQVVHTLTRFLIACEASGSFTNSKTEGILDRLLYLFGLTPSVEPMYLPQFMAYVTNLWASDTITVANLGYIDWASAELEKL